MNPPLQARITSLQVGLPRSVETHNSWTSSNQTWTTGFFKDPIAHPVWLNKINLTGDGQADLDNHGGVDKAVNVYPQEHYPYWENIFGLNLLPLGAFGENFTTHGFLENDVCIGDIYAIGDSLVEISQPRQPCWKLARRWNIKDLALRVQDSGRTGWYFRVLREGNVQVNDTLALMDRPHPEWSVFRANLIMHHQVDDMKASRALANCPALSSRWKIKLTRRVSSGAVENHSIRLYGQDSEAL